MKTSLTTATALFALLITAAALLDLTVENVRKWLAAGEIPSKKKGKRRWVRRQDFLEAFNPGSRPRRRKASS